MIRYLLALLIIVLAAPSVQAQSACPNPCVLKDGQSFSVVFDQPDTANVTGFRLYIDDAQVGEDIPLSALSGGSVTVPALTAAGVSDHTLKVSSFNLDHETFSDPVAFSVRAEQPPPAKPANVRIVITLTVADGKVTVKVVGAVPETK